MLFYAGDYTRLGGPGAALCRMEGNRAEIIDCTELADPNYMILSRDKRVLYVVCTSSSEGEDADSVASYDVTNGFSLLSIRSTGGKSACHLTLSPDEKTLYAANYDTGSIAVFPVEDGRIGRRIQLVQHEGHGPFEGRQEAAHAHFVAIRPEDGRLCAVDLGIDRVMIYDRKEDGTLVYAESAVLPGGSGPRHLVFDGNLMYVVTELASTVCVFRRRDQAWMLEQSVSALPQDWTGESWASAIRLKGRFVYASNRGHDSIAVFERDEQGLLALKDVVPVGGGYPRDFVVLSGNRVLAACQNSGGIRLVDMAAHTAECMLEMKGAVCLCPAEEND